MGQRGSTRLRNAGQRVSKPFKRRVNARVKRAVKRSEQGLTREARAWTSLRIRSGCARVDPPAKEKHRPSTCFKRRTTSFNLEYISSSDLIFSFLSDPFSILNRTLSTLSPSFDEHLCGAHQLPRNHRLGSCEPRFRHRRRRGAIFGRRPKSQKLP